MQVRSLKIIEGTIKKKSFVELYIIGLKIMTFVIVIANAFFSTRVSLNAKNNSRNRDELKSQHQLYLSKYDYLKNELNTLLANLIVLQNIYQITDREKFNQLKILIRDQSHKMRDLDSSLNTNDLNIRIEEIKGFLDKIAEKINEIIEDIFEKKS